ncbi:MAG TPA: aromatic amino acid ammonia-lyase [Steroidobacteraceae bacterium]|nr:aromatic amino acid ammonia-lyase [Steroidobacteraceae bacterium]
MRSRFLTAALASLCACFCVCVVAQAREIREAREVHDVRDARGPLLLSGEPLSTADVIEVARQGRLVAIDPAARDRVARTFEVVLAAARAHLPVYGLTTGVGWNKDKEALKASGALDPDLIAASERFNLGTLRAHAAGVGEPLADDVVRAAMVVRLNLLLTGAGGVQPAVVDQYAAFLNRNIIPIVPDRGSVGEADILQSAHIGLALAGEWQVRYAGKVLPAAQVLQATGLKPVALVGKDFLAIIGDNSLTIAQGLLAVHAARAWLDREITVFALSLEGLNGNVAPFLEVTVAAHPLPGFAAVAGRLRSDLAGSDLWNRGEHRPLQDPLSFRTMPIVLGNAWEALEAAESALLFAANHSGDNPVVLTDARNLGEQGSQTGFYLVPEVPNAAIVPTANFEALPVVAALERVSLALGHASESITESVLRFENPAITGLPRFLTAPENPGHGFGAIQKAVVSLNSEIRALALPVSLESAVLAGNIEDITSSAPLTARRLSELIEDLYPLTSLQLLHAAQAVELRKGFHLGTGTRGLLLGYRSRVPFVTQDRILTEDIATGVHYLRGLPP